MSENIFIIHIIFLGVLTFATFVGGVVFAFFYCNDIDEFAGVKIKKKKWLLFSIFCFLLSLSGLAWWIASAGQPWRTSLVTTHEIKDVIWPDGTKSQMFSCDGQDHNLTQRFLKIVDKDTWVVKRIRWNPLYLGVSWSTSNRCNSDQFYLEDTANPNKSIEL